MAPIDSAASPATAVHPLQRQAQQVRRAYWLKTLHEWHWVSSAICLVGMLLFAVTGFTLNHAGQIEAKAQVTRLQAHLPAEVVAALANAAPRARNAANAQVAPVPAALQRWAGTQWRLALDGRDGEWSDDELYITLPRPGGDAWLRIGLEDGAAEYERTDRGWIAYLNDLHKGRNTGALWRWFIDLFAAACLVFCITGFFILQMHAARRPFTWPLVGLGLLVPALLALLFMHT